MAARNEFDTDLDDAEQGASGSNIQINQAEFETTVGSALQQSCFCLPSSVNPTTVRLPCVSSSLLQAAPGGANQFGDPNQTGQGWFGTPRVEMLGSNSTSNDNNNIHYRHPHQCTTPRLYSINNSAIPHQDFLHRPDSTPSSCGRWICQMTRCWILKCH